MPAFPRLDEPLSDGVVSLRPSAERDIPEVLIAFQDDPELHLRLGLPGPPSGAQLGRHAEAAEAEREAGVAVRLTIVEAGADVCRGRIGVHTVDWENRRAELGIWVVPQLRRRGLARRGLALAGRWLLESVGLERAGLMTEPENEAMIRAGLAAGFHDEGVLRGYTLEGARRVDNRVLSLIRSDLAG